MKLARLNSAAPMQRCSVSAHIAAFATDAMLEHPKETIMILSGALAYLQRRL